MSTTPLLPQSFWFRLSIPCRRVDGVPKPGGKGLFDLPVGCRLPQTAKLDGKSPWAEVRLAWNPKGLAVVVRAEGTLDALGAADRPEGEYGVQVWVDTRDTRDVSRATRFCHRFDARLVAGTKGNTPSVTVHQRTIARAVADAPTARANLITTAIETSKAGWRLALFLPAEALNGYDPDTNRRLGFYYQVNDPERPAEFLGVGREFPVGENPSLWSTLELVDPE
jgi:hypothetical protein